jgi:hypothetical protein
MGVESAERPEGAWARAEMLEPALWVLGLFWGALVLAMAVLTPVTLLAPLALSPLAAAAGLSVCLRLHRALARPRA